MLHHDYGISLGIFLRALFLDDNALFNIKSPVGVLGWSWMEDFHLDFIRELAMTLPSLLIWTPWWRSGSHSLNLEMAIWDWLPSGKIFI